MASSFRLRRSAWVVAASLLLAACGASNKKRVVIADAGTDTGAGGTSSSGGAPASGGSVAASGGKGGSGGARATDGGHDASVVARHDASADAGPLSCAADAGKRDAGSQWHDFAAGVCRQCPGTIPPCNQVGVEYDPTTRVLVIDIPPGADEIVSATFSFVFYDASGYNPDAAPVAAVVSGNKLTFDLSGETTASVRSIQGAYVHMTDACDQSGDTGPQAMEIDLTPDAGKVGVTVSCYDNV